MSSVDLVNFPNDGDWEDSGEGGLYVLLVVPEPDDWDDGCHRDVSIVMTSPDVVVTPEARDFWDSVDHRSSGFSKSIEASKIFKEMKRDDLNRWAMFTTSPEDYSRSVVAAMVVGSTPCSLYSDRDGHYFDAAYEDLKPEGKALFDGLRAAYAIEPVLITFLDT